jgi:hypothetical protein
MQPIDKPAECRLFKIPQHRFRLAANTEAILKGGYWATRLIGPANPDGSSSASMFVFGGNRHAKSPV